MRFEFTEDQRLFQETVRSFLAAECPPDEVRAAWESEEGWSDRRWRALAEMGVVGIMLPEAHGGLGGTELDMVLLLEESGRVALPEPVLDAAFVAAPLLADVGTEDLHSEWLPRVAVGDAVLGVQRGSRAHITGAHLADALVLVHNDEVHLVPREQVTLTPQQSVDGSRKLFVVDWHRHPDTLVAEGELGWLAVNRAFDRGVLGTAAQLVGLADRMLAMAVEYAREREQFGQPIGSFQAVKHQLADALLAVEFARPVAYRAAYSMAHDDPDRSRDVSMAKVYAADAAHHVARTALQVHGAIGYTVEYDLHLFMKRAWALEASWGDPAWHRERVALAVLGPPGTSAGPVEEAPLGETLA